MSLMARSAAIALVLGGLLAGCGALTRSQVNEVAAFARAAEDYGVLPGEPIRVYGRVAATDRLFIVSSRNFEAPDARAEAVAEVRKAYALPASFARIADEADAALSVLDTYAAALVVLSSDRFTEALEATAGELSTSLDRAITTYNHKFRQPRGQENLKLVGASVAAAVQTSGSLFIRARQHRYLKAYVADAEESVGALTQAIEWLMLGRASAANPRQGVEAHLEQLGRRLEDTFETAAGRVGVLPLATVITFGDTLHELEAARELCRRAAAAAVAYRAAHARLRDALTERRTIAVRLQEIDSLRAEIESARALKTQLEKSR